MKKFVALVLILCLVGFVWVVGCGETKPTPKANPPATPSAGDAGKTDKGKTEESTTKTTPKEGETPAPPAK
jgi:hypothetical protein